MKKKQGDIAIAIKAWIDSWGFIFQYRLAHFFIYPILITILLSMGAAVAIHWAVDIIMNKLGPYLNYTPLSGSLWEQLKTIAVDFSKYALTFLIFLFTFSLFNRFQKYIVLILMSPIMAVLSEKTDKILSSSNFPFSWAQFIRDIARGVLLALRNFILEFFLTTVIWCAGIYFSMLFPPLCLILMPALAIVSFLVGAYYYGFSVMDYSNERRKLSLSESIRLIRNNRKLAISTGVIFSLLFMIPFVGVAMSTVTCTVSAILAMKNKNPHLFETRPNE